MEKQIYEILKAVQNGEQSIGDAQSQLLLLFSVGGSFPLSFVEWMTGHDSDSIMQLFNDFNKWK